MTQEIMFNGMWIITFIVITVSVAHYVFSRGKKGLYDAALYLVTIAEEDWGGGTGKIKFSQVLTTLKQMFPFITLFLKEQELSNIIETALDEMKRILQEKKKKEETASKTIE